MFFSFNNTIPTSVSMVIYRKDIPLPPLEPGTAFLFWAAIMNYRNLDSTGLERTGGAINNIELSIGKNDSFVGFASNSRLVQPFPSARDAGIVAAYNRTTIDSCFVYREDPVTADQLTMVVKHKEALANDVVLIGFRLYYELVKVTAEESIRFLV